jgi:hypothetical protein
MLELPLRATKVVTPCHILVCHAEARTTLKPSAARDLPGTYIRVNPLACKTRALELVWQTALKFFR